MMPFEGISASPSNKANPFKTNKCIFPKENYTLIQDEMVERIAPLQKAEFSGNRTKFFFIDKIKDLEKDINNIETLNSETQLASDPTKTENKQKSAKTDKMRTQNQNSASQKNDKNQDLSLCEYVLQEHKKLNDVNNKTVMFKNMEPFKFNMSKRKNKNSNSLSKDYGKMTDYLRNSQDSIPNIDKKNSNPMMKFKARMSTS